MEEFNCRVCGLRHSDAIWGKDNVSPKYEICDCCGAEFGNDDYTIESIIRYRNKWFTTGLKWFNNKARPKDWSIQDQILNVLPKYRELDNYKK